MRFVEWTSKQDDYVVILTTNWDFLIDVYVEVYYGFDRSIDEGMVDLAVDGGKRGTGCGVKMPVLIASK